MSESIFLLDGERPHGSDASAEDSAPAMVVQPTEQARGPWDPRALHGGAPAALITAAFERMQPGAELRIARLGFEFLRPIPLAPLMLSTRIVRPGRRVQELAAELTTAERDHSAGGDLVCRASALRVQAIPEEVPEPEDAADEQPLAAPETGKPVRFSLNGSSESGFAATAMEMRWLDDPWALGPSRVWMRLRHPLLPDEPLTSLARLAGTADFGNGVGAALPFEHFLFINADLTIHLQRQPQGEWIGLHARTLLPSGGSGLAESVLHDVYGPVGRAFQTLVVQPR
ncbi:MAG: thioesterase family protein [Solirubrobacteraceae bacterium]|jgi:acyl-coenzyme A thioesterase PaaI-like protein